MSQEGRHTTPPACPSLAPDDRAALVLKAERERWARMLRDESAQVEQGLVNWSPEEVAQELRDMADRIERGDRP